MRKVIDKVLKDMFTVKNKKDYDYGKILSFMFSVSYLIYPVLALYHGHDFNDQDWAIGAAALLSGSGLHAYLKKDTEPSA